MPFVLVQAKYGDAWDKYEGQLMAEIAGSREEYAMNELGKRSLSKTKADEAMAKVRWHLVGYIRPYSV